MNIIVLGLVHKKDKILMIKRKQKDAKVGNLVWAFPGGRIKDQELKEEALIRGIKEETGIDVKIKKLFFARTYLKDQMLLLYYDCKPLNNSFVNSEPHEVCAIKWLTSSEALKCITSDIHPIVADFLHKLK